jgi:hypothetical protein
METKNDVGPEVPRCSSEPCYLAARHPIDMARAPSNAVHALEEQPVTKKSWMEKVGRFVAKAALPVVAIGIGIWRAIVEGCAA